MQYVEGMTQSSLTNNQQSCKGRKTKENYESFRRYKNNRFTHMQAGPTCTQLLAWFGAFIKVERPKTGDGTRHQLIDIPDTDSLSKELNLKTSRIVV